VPDLFVKERSMTGTSITDDGLVIFEVVSPSNTKSDQAWRRRVYGSVPNCQHYVTVATKSASAVRYDRATGWQPVAVNGLAAKLVLPAIDVAITLQDIYRWTPIC
jgi:hypothetical protein